MLLPLVSYVRDQHGEDVARRVLRGTGVSPADLAGSRYWLSHAQFEEVLAGCRALLADDEEFRIACKYRLAESYGPLRYLVRAASVGGTLMHAARTMHLVSRISRYEPVEVGPTHLVWRYVSNRRESRLMCLSRIAQNEAFPTLWGLPQAQVEETSCLAKGDEACTYHLQWYQSPRWLPALGGALLGGAGAVVAVATGGTALVAGLMPVIGALAGHLGELRRVNRLNVAFSEESNESLRELARENAEAVQEITALNQRHREWSRRLEEQITARQRQMDETVAGMRGLMEQRELKARAYGHDMKNPLVVLCNAGWSLRPYLPPGDPEAQAILNGVEDSADRLSSLVKAFLNTAAGARDLVTLTAVPIEVPPLVEGLRRRLQAQVLGKEIRVSVFASREAPAQILCDRMLFDRVVDNLLTNAARYTAAGSIVVELAGTTESLVVKVSDTGAGLADDELRVVFRPGSTGRAPSTDSHGLGLSIVVRLLDQVGGRLEVLSRPGMGTTFWAHFPLAPRPAGGGESAPGESFEAILGRVLTIRAAND